MIRLQNVLKISWQDFLKASSKCPEDVLKMSWRRFSRRLEDVLKTFWRHLEDVLKTYGRDEYIGLDKDVLKTSSEDVRLRWTYSSWSRRLEDVFKRSSEDEGERRLEDVFKTASSRRMFAGTIFWDNFMTHLLGLISMRNLPYYERQLFNSIFTHLISSKVIRNKS